MVFLSLRQKLMHMFRHFNLYTTIHPHTHTHKQTTSKKAHMHTDTH